MAGTKTGSDHDKALFEQEFGITPTHKPYVEDFEVQIVNTALDDEWHGIMQLKDAIKTERAKLQHAKGTELRALHARMVDLSDRLEHAEDRCNRRVTVAKACGFEPKVYRN